MVQKDDNRVALRLVGKVQGVGFRWFVQSAAERLGINGWVRNTPDGHVELEAVGPAAALEEFRRRIEVGPPAARVTSVAELRASSEEFVAFGVRR
jgi:acylphosphatase